MPPADPEPLPEGWSAGTVPAGDIDVHYVQADTPDDAPALVICHGVFDDGPCREPLAADLAEDYAVYLLDARGHGRSDAPESGYAMADRVQDLVGAIDALGLEDPILFGHSMGGDTVAATAARHPDLPRAIVMEDPAGMLDHDESGEAVAVEAREQIREWHEHTKADLLETDDELAGHVADGDERLARLLANARLRVSPHVAAVFEHGWVDPAETYPEVTVPALVLKADADAAGRERDRSLAGHLPEGRLVHVEGAGHCVFRDDRETATAELRAFLDRV